MRKPLRVWAATGLLALALAGCSGSGAVAPAPTGPVVGIILPETGAQSRWEANDRVYLEGAIKDGGAQARIENARSDPDRFRKLADEMISDRVAALVIVSIDQAATRSVIAQARDHNIPVIEYDRMTPGAGASYFVGFDEATVARVQAEGLVRCLDAAGAKAPVVAELQGPSADPVTAQGYAAVLDSRFAAGQYLKGPDDQTPAWRGARFDQMMTGTGNRIDAVLAANDDLADRAIAVLRNTGRNGEVPVVGRGATLAGLRNVLTGDQCLTVYLTVKQEALAAGALALAVAKGQTIDTGQSIVDPETGKAIPAKLVTPQAITRDSLQGVVKEGFVAIEDLCPPPLESACKDAGLNVATPTATNPPR